MQAGELNMVGSEQGKERCGMFGRRCAFLRGIMKILSSRPRLSGSVSLTTSAKVALQLPSILPCRVTAGEDAFFMFGG